MIINHSHRFVFVHVPKAAGTAVARSLRGLTGWSDQEIGVSLLGEAIQAPFAQRFGLRKHSTAAEIAAVVGPEVWDGYFTFGFVRDPFRRLISAWRFLRSWTGAPEPYASAMAACETAEAFLASGLWREDPGPDGLFLPQASWVCPAGETAAGPGAVMVDMIGRVETIEADIARIHRRLGLAPPPGPPGLVNESPDRNRPVSWTPEAVAAVRDTYAADFALFGYAPEPGAPPPDPAAPRPARAVRRLPRAAPEGLPPEQPPPPLRLVRCRDRAAWEALLRRSEAELRAQTDWLAAQLPPAPRAFTLPGLSHPAGREVAFFCEPPQGPGTPPQGWRDTVVCPLTGLNMWMRAAAHVFDMALELLPDSPVLMMEQTGPHHRYFRQRHPGLIGCEDLGPGRPRGWMDPRGYRNEDPTALGFAEASFDAVLSFERLDRQPDWRAMLAEILRVLRPGGRLLLTVPFQADRESVPDRARRHPDGRIEHLAPPEFHHNPALPKPQLSYRDFGWDLLEALRAIGFAEAEAQALTSRPMGYYGWQLVLVARKG